MMFFETAEGEFRYSAVIHVEVLQGTVGREYYNIHLTGGQHSTIFESDMSRADFITEWKNT